MRSTQVMKNEERHLSIRPPSFAYLPTSRIFSSNFSIGNFPAFTMLVKWHTKSYAVKRPAKHPRCFHDYKELKITIPLLT
jgi:hypothetical protein